MKSQIKGYGFLIHFHYILEFLETCFLYARGNGPRGEVLAVLRAPTPQVASGYKNGLVSSLYTYFGLKASLFPIVLLTRDLSADELLENIIPLHPYPAPSCRRTELQIVVQGQPRLGQPGRPMPQAASTAHSRLVSWVSAPMGKATPQLKVLGFCDKAHADLRLPIPVPSGTLSALPLQHRLPVVSRNAF